MPCRHPVILRRRLLDFVRIFNERTDLLVKCLAVALLGSLILNHFLNVSAMVEKALRIAHIAVALGVIAYILGRLLLRDSTRIWSLVLTAEDYSMLREWLRTGKESDDRKCLCLVDFAAPAQLDTLVDLNFEGFMDTAFAVGRDDLIHRNAAWIAKNPRILMLMKDPIMRKEYIGYSALVPLNEGGVRLYLEGKLADADIPAELICGTEERPAAILVFAIVLSKKFSFKHTGADRQYSYYFWGCIRKHVMELYPELFKSGDFPPLYAQAERRRMSKRLSSVGFERTGAESAEGFPLWVLTNAARPSMPDAKAPAAATGGQK